MSEFEHIDLRFVAPPFDSKLTDLIIDLDYLRKKPLQGSTPPIIFFQMKELFHIAESVASARIEGNVTTVSEYIETKIETPKSRTDAVQEIQNMEACLEFIDDNVDDSKIDRAFVSELHKKVVEGLPWGKAGEGDKTPGTYRSGQIRIQGSQLSTPEHMAVPGYMDELFKFIDESDAPKYDLLKTAIAHHRFVWIHPFSNGNGRTVRMLTYAMLVKFGFNVAKGRIINPAAVFCSNRDDYYNKLSLADTGTDENLLAWCEYVLDGLKTEIEKIDRLLEYDFLKKHILIPTINDALDKKWITELEHRVLKRTIEMQQVKASDLKDIIKTTHATERSRVIRRLREKKMILPVYKNARKYTICFNNSYLTRGVMAQLYNEGFVPTN